MADVEQIISGPGAARCHFMRIRMQRGEHARDAARLAGFRARRGFGRRTHVMGGMEYLLRPGRERR
jgi:hypothetical protein